MLDVQDNSRTTGDYAVFLLTRMVKVSMAFLIPVFKQDAPKRRVPKSLAFTSQEHFPVTPIKEEVYAAVEAAIERLCTDDQHLLAADVSERSLSHRLAVHLIHGFPNHDIDCEYNRDGFNVKKLMLNERDVKDDELDAVTVFPDIIVHTRGSQDQNLLVIEMKKASSSVSHEYDIKKLNAFKTELKYHFAAHVVLGFCKNGQLVREVKWQ